MNQETIRCVNTKNGHIKFLVAHIANNPIRMQSIGYEKSELQTFPSLAKSNNIIEDTKAIEEAAAELAAKQIEVPETEQKKRGPKPKNK